jgi:hypothetical protein
MRSSVTGSDIMGRIEGLVAAGMPKEHLVRLSAALFAAGKTARRAGAPARQLADWCRDCLNKHPAGVEPRRIRACWSRRRAGRVGRSIRNGAQNSAKAWAA